MKDETKENAPTVLLVEDSATDTRIILRALKLNPRRKDIVTLVDGELAMTFLKSAGEPRPGLILLDLNLPKKDGWEVLTECKNDPALKTIPIVVFTTSQMGQDVRRCYALGANGVVAKPFELEHFMNVVRSVEDFWLGVAESERGR